jgi:hypothetical protein
MTDLGFAPVLVQPRHRLLRVLACLVVLAVLATLGVVTVARDLGKAVDKAVTGAADGFGQALVVSGAVDAAQASDVAHSKGVVDGGVTLAEVQSRVPTVKWVSGTVPSTNLNEASVAFAGNHVTTAVAVATGLCDYGLAVTSSQDPVVAADGLPGGGVFVNSVSSAVPGCAADNAPTSGWTRASSTELHDAGVAVYPVSG